MGLFDRKKTEETNKKEKKISSKELRKQLEEAEKKEQEEERKKIEKQKFNEIEDMEDFVTDEEISDTDITKEIEKYLENNGTEETINFLKNIITRLNVQLVLEALETNNDISKENESEEPEFKE